MIIIIRNITSTFTVSTCTFSHQYANYFTCF